MAPDDAAGRADDTVQRRARVAFDDATRQGAGVVQGGVLAGALADAVDAFAQAALGAGGRCELETLDVRLERPARPGACSVEAVPTKVGRSLVAWDAVLVDADRAVVATARITYRVRVDGA